MNVPIALKLEPHKVHIQNLKSLDQSPKIIERKWPELKVTEDAEVKELCREVARRYLADETTGPEADALADRLRATASARDSEARAAWEAWEARAAVYQNFVGACADEILGLLRAAPVPVEVGS